jgi:hypothetical protein
VRNQAAKAYAVLQLAQLEALQEEHPEDIEWVAPSLDRETPLKLEKSLSISFDWHRGQAIPFSDDAPKTSFSNSDSHFRHLYSKIGMATSSPPCLMMVA